jgi:hypothetical protein
MNIRAKMLCLSVTRHGQSEEVKFIPVYSSDPESENAKWAKATPGGELRLWIDNPSAQGAFAENKNYFVDISPAE